MKSSHHRKVDAQRSGIRFDRPDLWNGQVLAKTLPGQPKSLTRTLLPAELLHTLGEFEQRSESYFDASSGQLPGFDVGNLSVTANAFPKRTHSANAFPARHLPGSRRPAPTFHNNVDDSISRNRWVKLSANLHILMVKENDPGECGRETPHLLDRYQQARIR